MAFKLPKLPFDLDALAPLISKETLKYHHEKHHQGYVNKLNKLIEGTEFANKTLEKIIQTGSGSIFNNAAQVWNHSFYWNCLTFKKNQRPSEKFLDIINQNFGSLESLKTQFTKTALSLFGSGWTWLVQNPDKSLSIIKTSNAGNPMTEGQKPLLTCDVWEHAYYIDYRNARATYVKNFWDLIHWDFMGNQLD